MKLPLPIYLILILLPLAKLSAQATFAHNDVIDLIDMLNIRHGYDGLGSDVEGSPYLDNLFVIGNIYYEAKPSIENVPVRYNIYTDQIEYYYEERVMELLTFPIIEKVMLGDTTLVYEAYQEGKEKNAGYFQLLFEGEVSLLLKMEVKYYEKTSARPLQDPKPAKFKRLRDVYYVRLPNTEVMKLKKIKNMVDFLPEHQDEALQFIKEKHISSRNTKELITFFEYYNSLITK